MAVAVGDAVAAQSTLCFAIGSWCRDLLGERAGSPLCDTYERSTSNGTRRMSWILATNLRPPCSPPLQGERLRSLNTYQAASRTRVDELGDGRAWRSLDRSGGWAGGVIGGIEAEHPEKKSVFSLTNARRVLNY